MKVLQINTVCGTGSTGRIVVDLYHKLVQEGHECVVAYGRGYAPKGIRSIRIGGDFNNNCHALMTRITDRTGFYSRHATRKFVKWLEEYQPDLIHLHNLHGYYMDIKQLFAYIKKYTIPVVWTLHDCWAFTGHCSHFDFIGCKKWRTGCHNCQQKQQYPKSIVWDSSKWNYDQKRSLFTGIYNMQMITPSVWLKSMLKQSFLKEYPVECIPNGIDMSVFTPKKNNILDSYGINKKRVILGVSNVWSDRKGLNDFFELSKRLGEDYQVILIGLTEKQIKRIPKSIIGIQKTDNIDELAAFYTAADIYINLSCEETFGMTTVEAMACGTPVIVYDRTAISETVENDCGVIVEYGDLNGVIDAVKQMELQRMESSRCIRRAKEYQLQNMLDQYLNVYQRMQRNSPRRQSTAIS